MMEVKFNPGSGLRPAYYKAPARAAKPDAPAPSPAGRTQDSVDISPEGRAISQEAQAEREAYTAQFGSFLDELDKLLTSADGSDPVALLDLQANQNVRARMEQGVGALLGQKGVQIPAGASLILKVDAADYRICAEGVDDPALLSRAEDALNQGDNGRRLYRHIQYCNPARYGLPEPAQFAGGGALGIMYRDGCLLDLDTKHGFGPGQTDWQVRLRENPEEAGRRYMEQAEKLARVFLEGQEV